MPPRLLKPKVLEQVQCYFYHIILVKAKHKASPHSERQRDISCWKMRHVTCRGAWIQRGVIPWRSFYNLLQTHKIFCVKKKSIKKDKGEFFKGHDVLEKFNLKFFASLCLSLHKSALRKDQVRNQQEDSCLQVRKRVFIRSWAPALRLPSFISSYEERNFCCLSCLWHCVVAAWINAIY